MNCPVIVVTGPIASGKTTVAKVLAGGEGSHLAADLIAHGAFRDKELSNALRGEFGDGIFEVDGEVSRSALAAIVFGDERAMSRLNSLVKPVITSLIEGEIARNCESSRYIVLDAVLFFEYKFRFKAGMVVLVDAPPETRLERLMIRDGISRKEARTRIEGQRYLESGWVEADVRIDTSVELEDVKREAALVRERFIRENVL